MDNGQSGGNAKKNGIFSATDPDEQAYFTPGVGNEPVETNNFASENNLDEENWQKALEVSTPAGMPTPEQIAPTEETETTQPIEPANESDLGKITPINTPQTQSQNEVKPYNPTNIKTTGDYLDKGSLAEIEKLEEKLNQDGDLNAFYDHTRDLTEVNLDNSFSRKLYQDGGEK